MLRRDFLRSTPAVFALPLLSDPVAGQDKKEEPKEKEEPKKKSPNPAEKYIWCGAVTSTSAKIVVKVPPKTPKVFVVYGIPNDPVAKETAVQNATEANDGSLIFTLTGLKENTKYLYTTNVGGFNEPLLTGNFQTFPKDGAAENFRICFASCAETGSKNKVFSTIRDLNPRMFIHMGDFHYEDIKVSDPALRRKAYAQTFSSFPQQDMYRNTALAYMWDDHDFLGNGSGGGKLAKEARDIYRACVPHYPLALGNGDKAIAQAFTFGRVRFILTDLRSARTDGSLMGEEQKKWFKKEVKDSHATHGLIVWMSTVPWIGDSTKKGADFWCAAPDERKELANFFKAEGIKNICIISGDSHMIAIDEGKNADYAEGGGAPIPVFQAAALDRKGSVKGGPYSKGTFPGGGQFGLMEVQDDGKTIKVTWSGRNAEDKEIVGHKFEVNGDKK